MARYSPSFKREVVDTYLRGDGSRTVAALYKIDHKRVQQWVALYRQHGQPGQEGLHQHYSAEFKLQVLQHMQREDLSSAQATALYGIRGNRTVSRWEQLYHASGAEALAPRPRGLLRVMPTEPAPTPPPLETPNSATREELLKEIERLRAEVAYLKKAKALVGVKKSMRPKKPGSCSN